MVWEDQTRVLISSLDDEKNALPGPMNEGKVLDQGSEVDTGTWQISRE